METRDWLRAAIAFGAGNGKLWEYIRPDEPDECIRRLLSDETLQHDRYVCKYKSVSNEQLDSIFDICERHGITVTTIDSEDYPYDLRFLDAPPAVLFAKGDIGVLNRFVSAAIVGSRDCTRYGAAMAAIFARAFAAQNVCTVSGSAVGIDTAAHDSALASGGYTAAFLGCGLLCDYPKGSLALRKCIAEKGVVVSEYLPTALPAKENFKVRNRLIAGVSDCVLVAEAGIPSGALNTASLAAEMGKEVFVIPPSDLTDKHFWGQSELLAEGASIALSPESVLEYLRQVNG